MKARWNKVMEKKKGNKSEEYVQDHLLKVQMVRDKGMSDKGRENSL